MLVPMLVYLAKLIAAVLAAVFRVTGRRVPKTTAQAQKMAEAIFPAVARGRAMAARAQAVAISTHMRKEYGLKVTPAEVRPYVVNATFRAVCRSAGLTPQDRSSHAGVADGHNPSPPRDAAEFEQRLGRALDQHIRNAARDLVVDTANLNEVERVGGSGSESDDDYEEFYEQSTADFQDQFDTADDWWEQQERDLKKVRTAKEGESAEVLNAATEKREKRNKVSERRRPGVVLGWARVLSGETNCAFCAMLASRGAVYKSEKTAGFEPHPKCDCHAELVVKGQRWDGDSEAAALQDLWEDARDHPNDYERQRMQSGQLSTPAARFRSRINEMVRLGKMGQFKASSSSLAAERIAKMNLPYRVA